jgi:hypothetical protein
LFTPKKKLEGGDLKAFGAQLKGAFRNARGSGGARPPSNGTARPAQPTQPTVPDDDIPF